MVEADYYDGRSTRRQRVRLLLDGSRLRVVGEGIDRGFVPGETELTEKLGRAPRLLRFADGAYCEIGDHEGLEDLLARAGYREAAVDLAQRSLPLALVALLLTLAVVAAGYVWGVPMLADTATRQLPDSVNRMVSEHTLSLLDGGLLEPSKTPPERQQELRRKFERLVPAKNVGRAIEFRASPLIGPNAMALPDGRMVVLDELLALLEHDEQLLAVLAHEYGHVQHDHGMRLALRSTLTAALAAWWLGDVSSLLAAAPTALTQARYSREFEVEADAFAATLLRQHGIAPGRLAEVLEKLAAHDKAKAAAEDEASWHSYLSTHPATAARIRALRESGAGR
ncbi:MAG TPA: M48 family metallopeptidase [Solimonas sp.]|nr:M48 family metallopeptidase [Solimonas sp.]